MKTSQRTDSSCGLWQLGLLLLSLLLPATLRAQFTPALPGYHYQFPRDNFNHPGYQTEWWYYTGNLRAADGHRFGFELTFFRQALSQQPNTSPWSLNDVYMAHLALSDLSGHHYYADERLNRAGPGIAGIDPVTGTVWNGNWQAVISPTVHTLRGIGDTFSLSFKATPLKAPTLHGTDGVSQKAAGAGNASHYISYTRMQTTGTVTLNGTTYTVDGDTWMDHEFFSDTVTDEVGWDWLSIQLNNDTELMLYRLRHKDGSVDPYSSGSFIDAQGKALHLTLADFTMTATGDSWKSPTTGATYPLAWSVTVPKLQLQLGITTPLQTQEFHSRFGPSYWEGSIDITGQQAEKAVVGTGYLEMTGYATGSGPLFSASPR